MKPTKTTIIIGTVFLLVLSGCAGNANTLEKNYGHSYGEVNIGEKSVAFNADDIVPSKEELIGNLEKAEFAVSEYDNALSFAYGAECIHAEKDGHFVDICYSLSVENAPEAFASYEKVYEDYYVLAQNGPYVYVVSDAETFELAGFESLETDGILYVWK
jgi:uncharacterized lipoprotein NlpE involved in copper resistance